MGVGRGAGGAGGCGVGVCTAGGAGGAGGGACGGFLQAASPIDRASTRTRPDRDDFCISVLIRL